MAKKKLSESYNGEISRLFKMRLIMVEDMKKDHDSSAPYPFDIKLKIKSII